MLSEKCGVQKCFKAIASLPSCSPLESILYFIFKKMEYFHHKVWQHHQHDASLYSSVEFLTSYTAAQSHLSKPNPVHCCRSDRKGKCCDLHYFSSALRCSTSRILHIPKQEDRALWYHTARSYQSAGP